MFPTPASTLNVHIKHCEEAVILLYRIAAQGPNLNTSDSELGGFYSFFNLVGWNNPSTEETHRSADTLAGWRTEVTKFCMKMAESPPRIYKILLFFLNRPREKPQLVLILSRILMGSSF